MRQVVLDTETTGLELKLGHRVIEVGCVELVNRRRTARTLHHYLQPDRDIDPGAQEVHGISIDMLQDKPRFSEIAEDFLGFIAGAELVIHNADFDVGFLNAELRRTGRQPATVTEVCSGRRYAGSCAPPASRSAQQPRCALQALQHRQLRP